MTEAGFEYYADTDTDNGIGTSGRWCESIEYPLGVCIGNQFFVPISYQRHYLCILWKVKQDMCLCTHGLGLRNIFSSGSSF